MLDIETMGTDRRAPVLAVGLVPFQLHREECAVAPDWMHFEARLTLEENRRAGRNIDPATVEWWLQQSDAARTALLQEPRFTSIYEFGETVVRYLEKSEFLAEPKELHVWAKPPTFDCEILRDLLGDALPLEEKPWSPAHRLERDCRPLIDLAKLQGWADCFPEPSNKHSALADATAQAEQVVRIYRRVMGWQQ
jgi:hypothetical protein